MSVRQQLSEQGLPVRRFEYDDQVELTADFGPGTEPSVDVVGGTVIVVADDGRYEVDAGGDAQAFIRNGVLTIEVSK
jgi:hypothetical protein